MFLTKAEIRQRRWRKFWNFMGMIATSLLFAATVLMIFALA